MKITHIYQYRFGNAEQQEDIGKSNMDFIKPTIADENICLEDYDTTCLYPY